MNAAQLEQYRDLLARMSKARTADAATTDALVLAVDALVTEVERLQRELASVPVKAIHAACRAAENDGAEVGDVWEWLWEFAPNLYTLER